MIRKLVASVLPFSLRKRIAITSAATYCNDGLITNHNSDFLKDPRFLESYALGKATGSWGELDLEWRAYIACWAADRGKRLDGDFVECGVNRGGLSRTVMHYIGFDSMVHKRFYLLDTFNGFPQGTLHPAEPNLVQYRECYHTVCEIFRSSKNVSIVRGPVPQTLVQVDSDRVCYLSLDMNCAEPEIAAAEFFWHKLSSGAVMLLDDYGYSEAYRRQKQAFDEFAFSHNVAVLLLPTGQGMIIKP